MIAAIVVASLLGDLLDESASGDVRSALALATLQESARDATDSLRAMGRHGAALARWAEELVADKALRRPSGGDGLEGLAPISALFDQLDDTV